MGATIRYTLTCIGSIMNTQIAPLQPGFRIQLPAEWARDLGLQGQVALDKTSEGILVRPCLPKTDEQRAWDAFFAEKLVIGSNTQASDEIEVSKDDLLF